MSVRTFLLAPLLVLVLASISSNTFGIDFEETARGSRGYVYRQPVCTSAEACAAPVTAVTPAASSCPASSSGGPSDCNTCQGVQSSTQVGPPITTLHQQTFKVDCTKLEYADQQYTTWEPREYPDKETYTYKVAVPYTRSGVQKLVGYRPVEVTTTVKQAVYNKCGCFVGYENVPVTSIVNQAYTYERPYSYTENKIEDRVASREVTKIKMVPIQKEKQIPVIVPDVKYVEQTILQATYTVTTTYQNEVPKAQGAVNFARQQAAERP